MVFGGTSPAEQDYLTELAREMGHVAEIGFNEGHSARALLAANDHIRVVSFELAGHDDIHLAKFRIDAEFPGRHTLVPGDSRVTVRPWAGEPFDLMFVDGAHDYETITMDLWNSLAVVRPGGLIMIDDLTPWKPWGIGPVRAWEDFTRLSGVLQTDLRMDGQRIAAIPADGAPDARVWAAGLVSPRANDAGRPGTDTARRSPQDTQPAPRLHTCG